jgi:hypothetical protein
MRLLERKPNGELVLTEHNAKDVPPYAILSHTWAEDNSKEVSFQDVEAGIGERKPGWKKIHFCANQAAADSLRFFWIDTCCINKENEAELRTAINSMFRWYRNAARCYVYLSDVSSPPVGSDDECNPQPSELDLRKSKWLTWDWTLQAINFIFYWYRNATRRYIYFSGVSSPAVANDDDCNPRPWESDFRKSRWFTRGWTLQELLAPASVEFFSREGKWLGDKSSLEEQIYEITRVPKLALQGAYLSQFPDNERFSWIQHRKTKFEEDKVYSLLGVFDVDMPLSYGEGWDSAHARLKKEIDKLNKCIQDLRLSDPRYDKKRIEDTKGGLLEGSYRWIFENSDFQRWRSTQQSRLLWIKGDPGKGKTMLLCGIINELKESIAKSELLSYFFCQATDSRINNATAVLRGLIYLLIDQQPSLVSHVQTKYDQAGKMLFEDANAWFALSDIFTNLLQDPTLNATYLIIDALDECVEDLPKLLDFIVRMSSVSPRIRWIVSSRNWLNIEKYFDTLTEKVGLCLELNEQSISAAVMTYIQFKVDWLSKRNIYSSDTRDAVESYLSRNANGTFLWVALVCQELSDTLGWKAQQKLTSFPPGLDGFYRRMMNGISNSEDADLCHRILAVVSAAYRPLTLDELESFVEMPNGVSGEYKALSEIIGLCGSFLALQEQTVSFIHQSAKDFLVEKAHSEIYPSGLESAHYTIFFQSLQAMSKIIRRNIYSLDTLGFSIDQVKQPDLDPLSSIRYSCVYWIDHLLNCDPTGKATNDLQDDGPVDKFLRQRYLYWLEALSLCRSMSDAVVSIAKLEALLQVNLNPAFMNNRC